MKYVALLRGINVGGKNTIKMSELKSCLEVVGLSDVKTYINSGNVIFTSEQSEKELVEVIEGCIKKSLKLDVPVIVVAQTQIEAIVAEIPVKWVNDQTMRTDILFLWKEVDYPSVINEVKINPEVDHLIYVPGAIVWNYDRVNYTKTKMRNFIGSHIYKRMTARNANTTRKLLQIMQSS